MSIEDLYKYYEILDQTKDKISEHESEYLAIVGAVKGSSQEKRLASQFVAKFFKYFPNHSEQALNAICNLCEDEDSAIRKQAIKDLPTLCKEAPSSLQRVSSVLTRLLQTDDVTEQNLVNMSLMSVLKQDAKETLTGIFSQITEGSEAVRDRALKFLINKIKLLPEVTKDVENLIVGESLKVLEDATGSEFVLFMKLLPLLKVMHTVQGRQHLVEIVTVQADLDIPFNVNDPEAVDRLVQCARQVLPLLSKNVHSDKFLAVLCDQVLPNLGQLQQQQVSPDGAGDSANNGDHGDAAAHSATTVSSSSDITTALDVLKLLAEMSVFVGDIKHLQTGLRNVFNTTLEYMPVPPAPAEEGAEAKAEPRLEFSHVECLLYALHQLARHKPDFLTDNEEQLKDFRARLQYFAHRTQQYIKDIKVNLANRKPGDKSEEHQVKVMALKVTNNIATLIKDLFHTPPSYKVVVTPSWKSPVAVDAIPPLITPASATGTKRPSIEAPLGSKTEVKRYAPPTGKFSERTGGYRGREGRGYGRQGYWT